MSHSESQSGAVSTGGERAGKRASLTRRSVGRLLAGMFVLVVLAAPLVTLWFMRRVEVDRSSGSTPKWKSARSMTPTVELTSPQWMEDDRPICVSGTVCAWREARLSFLASGHVEQIGADMGDRVESGQELARLDRTQTQAVLEEAKARLAEAEWEWNRIDGLASKDLAADAELSRRKALLGVVRANVKSAEHMYEHGRLTAPFSGYIAERMIELGQFVSPSHPSFLLLELDQVKVLAGVTESQLGQLEKGDAVRFRVEAYPNREFTGQVDRLGVYTPQASATFEIEIAASNESGLLKPGMVAKVAIQARHSPRVLVLPVNAVRFQGDRATVFFYDAVGSFVEQRKVETGPLLPMGITIRSGLSANDRVVMRPGASMFGSQRVAIGDKRSEKSTRALAGDASETLGPSPESQKETARP